MGNVTGERLLVIAWIALVSFAGLVVGFALLNQW